MITTLIIILGLIILYFFTNNVKNGTGSLLDLDKMFWILSFESKIMWKLPESSTNSYSLFVIRILGIKLFVWKKDLKD